MVTGVHFRLQSTCVLRIYRDKKSAKNARPYCAEPSCAFEIGCTWRYDLIKKVYPSLIILSKNKCKSLFFNLVFTVTVGCFFLVITTFTHRVAYGSHVELSQGRIQDFGRGGGVRVTVKF